MSKRFLQPDELAHRGGPGRPGGNYQQFADGQWQDIRVTLERQGWDCTQIRLLHDQLRQGWPLAMAKHNVTAMTGHCPLRSRQPG